MIKILFLTLILLFCSCSSKKEPSNSVEEHMILSNELSVLMSEIDMVIYNRFKSELQRDNIRRRYALSLVDEINELASSLKVTSPVQLKLDETEENIEIFNSFANRLNENAQEISKIAKNYELEKLPSSLEKVKITCNSCHNHFDVPYEK